MSNVAITPVKTAKAVAVRWDLACPHCSGDLYAPDGSVIWSPEDLDGSEIRCFGCGKRVRLPKKNK